MPYYLYRDHQVSGPYKLDDIRLSLRVDPDALICEEESGLPDGRWYSLTDLVGEKSFPVDFLVNEGQSLNEEFDELKWAAPFFRKGVEKSREKFSEINKKTKDVLFDVPETSLFEMEPRKSESSNPPAAPAESRMEPSRSDFEELKRYLQTLEEKIESLRRVEQAKDASPIAMESLAVLIPHPPSVSPPLAVQMPSPPPPEPVQLNLKPLPPSLAQEEAMPQNEGEKAQEASISAKERENKEISDMAAVLPALPEKVSDSAPVEQEPIHQEEAPAGELHFQVGESWDSSREAAESTGGGLQIQMGDSFEIVDEGVQENQDLALHVSEPMSQETNLPPIQASSASSVEAVETSPPMELESPLPSSLELAVPQSQAPSISEEPPQELPAPQNGPGLELTPAVSAQDAPVSVASEASAPAVENPSSAGANSFVFPTINQNPENPPLAGSSSSSGGLESLIQAPSFSDVGVSTPVQLASPSPSPEPSAQIVIESSIEAAQGQSSEPLITPIFNQPGSPSSSLGAASEGVNLSAPLEVGAPSPFQTAPGSQDLLERFAKPDSSIPDKNQAKKAAKKSRSKLLPVLGLGVVVLAAVSFFLFFRNPKDLSNMLSPGATQRPLGLDQSSQPPVQGAQPSQGLPMPSAGAPAQTAASPASVTSPASSAQTGSPTSNPSPTPSQNLSSPLPQSPEKPQTPKTLTPSEQSIELVKQYPLEGPKANVGKWFDYAFGGDSAAKEEWSAGKLSKGVYLVRYRVTFGRSSKRKAVVYLFQSDIAGGMVLGDNGAARRLLSGEAPMPFPHHS